MNQAIFLTIFNFFQSSIIASVFAIFLGLWLPYMLIIFGGIYDYLRMKHEGKGFVDALRDVVYFFTPPFVALGITELVKHFFPSPRPFLALQFRNATCRGSRMSALRCLRFPRTKS